MRGAEQLNKVHYKGSGEDFIIFVEDVDAMKKWKDDRTIPLAQVLNSMKIFLTHGQGNQGVYDGASKAALENEFGTTDEDEVLKTILEKGTLITASGISRQGDKNISQGPRVAH